MPPLVPATAARTTPRLLVRRMLMNLTQHPVWPAYSLVSARSRADCADATRLLARLEAGEAVPDDAVSYTVDALARVLARLKNYAETGRTLDG